MGEPAAGPRAGPDLWYAERVARHTREIGVLDARRARLGRFRVAAALLAIVLVILVDPLVGPAAWGAVGGSVVCVVAFAALVAGQRRLAAEGLREAARATLAAEGLARLARDWDALARAPEVAAEPLPPADHPYARDLGLFGRASLFRLCGPLTTPMGRARLAAWLLAPARDLADRQEAVRALAPAAAWRAELAAAGRAREPASAPALERFLGWTEAPGWLTGSRTARAGRLLPLLTVGLGGLHLAGVTGPLWIGPLLGQLLILRRVGPRVAGETRAASAAAPALTRYAAQLARVAAAPGGGAALDTLRRRAGGSEGAPDALRRLARLLEVADSRGNLFYPPLNAFLLVDVHLQVALERWKGRHGPRARGWLDTLGELEAIAGLATVAHDHPEWSFPEPEAESEEGRGGARHPVRARALGHPLLAPATCVRNDVVVPPPGAFLLVTGSNMSGKSTLLRAIGANVVLAQAGAPVCAEAFAAPAVRLHTSMAVEDSLEAGVSRFMAELLRMKAIVEAARAGATDDRPVLYLLDEILQGTNTWERRAGARAVLRHLLDAGAIGALTTHDLTLHQAPDLEPRARAFHFRESVRADGGGATLAFDHRLRPGLSTTRNALALLEAVGLGPLPGQAREDPAGGDPH